MKSFVVLLVFVAQPLLGAISSTENGAVDSAIESMVQTIRNQWSIEIERATRACQQRVTQFQREKEAAEAAVGRCESQKNQLAAQISNLQGTIQSLRDENDALRREIESLRNPPSFVTQSDVYQYKLPPEGCSSAPEWPDDITKQNEFKERILQEAIMKCDGMGLDCSNSDPKFTFKDLGRDPSTGPYTKLYLCELTVHLKWKRVN